MDFWFRAFDALWKTTAKSDAKTHSRQVLPPGITTLRDMPYCDDGDHYHLFDAYYPARNDGKLPVIIDIHGGGWMYADKDLNIFYNQYLAARGFLVFSVSYRLVPGVTPAEQLRDVSLALAAIKEKMRELPCDPEKVMLTGDSAGGMLAAFTAAISASPQLRSHFHTVDHGIGFSCVTLTSPVVYMNENSLIGAYGRIMWKEKPFRRSTAPYMNIDELLDCVDTLPPMLLITSGGDVLALKQTVKLHGQLMKKGVSSTLLNFGSPNGKMLPHVFAVLQPESKEGRQCLDKTCAFFRAVTGLNGAPHKRRSL